MDKVKVYICSSFPRRKEAQILALRLSPIMEIISTWHRDDTKAVPRNGEACLHRVMRDFAQVRKSNLVIIFIGDNLTGGGRHTELGLALGMRKDVLLIGEYDTNPFECIPFIRVYKSADNLVERFFALREDIEADYKWRKEQEQLNRLAEEPKLDDRKNQKIIEDGELEGE